MSAANPVKMTTRNPITPRNMIECQHSGPLDLTLIQALSPVSLCLSWVYLEVMARADDKYPT